VQARSSRLLGRSAIATFTILAAALASRAARADPPSPELMAKLGVYATRFERQRTHASYAIEGRLELLDADGNPASTKELWGHVDADGAVARLTVIRYLEDGKDKTEEGIREAREAAEKKKDKAHELKMPIRTEEQSRYVFDQVETDPNHPSRVRITFVPKDPEENTVEGSAWVDTTSGTPISAGFKLSKTPLFVDYVHFSVEFGAPTSLGPAVSKVNVDGKGGILFFRKHFRATANLSDYRVLP
jgi:hypothetical protein